MRKRGDEKRGAIELSIGTIVIVVLAMTMLILGLILIRTIFITSTDNVKQIDEKVKAEINKIFSEEETKTVVIYPSSRQIKLKQGESGGFAISLRNTDLTSSKEISYIIKNDDYATAKCKSGFDAVATLIILGKDMTGIDLAPGTNMEYPELVKFQIPENFPPACEFEVRVIPKIDGTQSGENSVTVSIKVVPK